MITIFIGTPGSKKITAITGTPKQLAAKFDKLVTQSKAPKPHPTDNLPVVEFYYPRSTDWGDSLRTVKVIEASKTHIKGLEVMENGGHQFKCFRRDRITGTGPWLKTFFPKSYVKNS